jgi:hypothetical protein
LFALCSQYPNAACEGRTAIDDAAFGPTPMLTVSNLLEIQGFTRADELLGMEIVSFRQGFIRVVPEPSILSLLGMALIAGLRCFRLRRWRTEPT